MKMDFQRIELAGAVGTKEELEVDFKKLKQIKNRMKKTDWLFLNACVGKFLGFCLFVCFGFFVHTFGLFWPYFE